MLQLLSLPLSRCVPWRGQHNISRQPVWAQPPGGMNAEEPLRYLAKTSLAKRLFCFTETKVGTKVGTRKKKNADF